MAAELKAAIRIDLKGNLAQQADRNAQAMERMARRSGDAVKNARSRIGGGKGAGGGEILENIGGAAAGLATGAVITSAVKDMATLEERYTRLGIAAQIGDEGIGRLKQNIRDTANAQGIKIDDEQLLSAVEQILEKTGDLKFAETNLKNLALVIQATGATGRDVGALSVELQKLGLNSPKEILEAFDTLNLQGKAGAFTLNNLATQGERVFSAFSAMGVTGPPAVQQLGALLQIARKGVGSPEMAATAFEAIIRDIGKNGKKIEAKGVQVFGPDNKLRSVPSILKELIESTGGDQKKMVKLLNSGIFEEESRRLMNVLMAEFGRTGKFEALENFLKILGDGKTTISDADRASKALTGTWNDVKLRAVELGEAILQGPVAAMAELYNKRSTGEKSGLVGTAITGTGLAVTAGGVSALTGFAGFGAATGGVAVAGGAGYGVGMLLNEAINRYAPEIGKAIGEAAVHTMAALGSKEARLTIELDKGLKIKESNLAADQRTGRMNQ